MSSDGPLEPYALVLVFHQCGTSAEQTWLGLTIQSGFVRRRLASQLAKLGMSIMLYTLRRHARVPVQIDFIGLPTLCIPIVFYTILRHARLQIDSIGLPKLNVPIALHTVWMHVRIEIDSTSGPH